MKQKPLGFLIAFLTTALFVVSSTDLSTETASAQKQEKQTEAEKTAFRPKSKRIKTIIKGAEKPKEIPDNTAYELFLRTVAVGNARGLVKRAGFSDDETIERIMSEAYSLNEILEASDRRAFDLKTGRLKPQNSLLAADLTNLQTKKDEAVARTVSRFLPQGLRDEKMNKLHDFIETEVKRNIRKIFVNETSKTSEAALSGNFIKTFAPQAIGGGGQLYLYSAAWNDEMSVFGSGSISEQYTSSTSYRATVTVTSSSGRSNTTVSDWNYATLVHDTGLSIGVEDGKYSVQASFEEQDGYYDEYGNFYGSGGSYVGSSTDSILVAPKVTVESVEPSMISLRSLQSGTFTATISTTTEVPLQSVVNVEFYETSYPQFEYSVNPSSRRQSFTVTQAGQTSQVSFQVSMGSTTSQGTGTDVKNKVRIMSVVPPQPSPSITIGANEPIATLTYSGTPTPTPTPTGGGGCLASSTEDEIKTNKQLKDKTVKTANRCSFCNPDWYELDSCQRSGGVYDWSACFCGQSPIVLDILGDGFNLTNPQNGVLFDILGSGVRKQMAWTSAETDDAWLALDRNRNNRIDDGKELFGNVSEQPAGQNLRQGFASLGMFDAAALGGNSDGQITRRDAVFSKLRLWRDANHNGISEPEELFRLPALDVVAISLDYKESNRTDEFGNRFKYRAKVRDRANAKVGRWAWDVFLGVQR